jgi:NhaP-type Na+/H+ or K+/H+ antiporter
MTGKEILSYAGGVAIFVLVGSLLRPRVPEELAFGIGALAMLLVGFPFTRYISDKQLTFRKWALFSTLGAIAGIVVMFALKNAG